MYCPVSKAAVEHPEALAIKEKDVCFNYARWNSCIEQTVQQLKQIGVNQGDRVALAAPNSWQYVTMLWALWRLGAIACCLNMRWSDSERQDAQKRLKTAHYLDEQRLQSLIPAHVTSDASVYQRINLAQPATILMTSGSSGAPKAVVHHLEHHLAAAQNSNSVLFLSRQDQWQLSLPLYHVGGMAIVVRCALAEACVVVRDAKQGIAASHVSLVATQLQKLIQNKEQLIQIKNCKVVLLGGSAIPAPLLNQAKEQELPIYVSYGMTEMASQVWTVRYGCDYPGLLPNCQIKLSEQNEICVKGASLFAGYEQEKGLDEARDEQGWYHTGDIGFWDQQHQLVVTGRKDRMFISGGENIHPEEIEKALLCLEGIEQAVVIACTSEEFGERPIAVLKRASNEKRWTRALLKQELLSRLAGYKIPDQFYDWPPVDKAFKPSPKVLKDALEASLLIK